MLIEGQSPLDNLHIASPCPASWHAMTGDDKARFCKTCQKNVFNISMLTRQEAEALILEKEGNLCVRLARRKDGTIITDDCPIGDIAPRFVHQPWQTVRYLAAVVLAVVVAVVNGQAKTVKQVNKHAAHAKKKAAVESHRPLPGGISFSMPTPTPTPRPITIIRGIERHNELKTPLKELTKVATKVQPKVIRVAPFKAPPKSDK